MADFVSEGDVRGELEKVVEFPGSRTAPKFKRQRFRDVLMSTSSWLVKNLLPAKGVGFIYGASTVGKSFVILNFGLRIARGRHVLGHRTKQAGVIYWAAEGQHGMEKRIVGIRERFGVEAPFFHYIGSHEINLLDDVVVEAMIQECLEAEAEMIAEGCERLGLITIDTLSASMPGGNENASEDMSRVLAAGTKISLRTGALVLFVAHPGKNEALGIRGWSGQKGNVDVVFYLAANDEDPELAIGIVEKLKDGPEGERFAYRLEEFEVGRDADGDPITTMYPKFEEPPATIKAPKKSRDTTPKNRATYDLILRSLGVLVDSGAGQTVPPVPGVPPGKMGVRRSDLRAQACRIGYRAEEDTDVAVKRRFNREIREMIQINLLAEADGITWKTK